MGDLEAVVAEALGVAEAGAVDSGEAEEGEAEGFKTLAHRQRLLKLVYLSIHVKAKQCASFPLTRYVSEPSSPD